MKAIKFKNYGGPANLQLTEEKNLIPADDQVLIAVEAAGVSAVDIELRSGNHFRPVTPPLIPGSDVAGTIIGVGKDVSKTWLGRRVYALISIGGYSEQVVTSQHKLITLPDNLSAINAVGLGVNLLTAETCLRQGRFTPGDKVLIRGASGGVGVAVTQLATLRGGIVTGVSSSEDKLARLKAIGATQVFNRDEINTTSEKYDVIIDPVAGSEMGNFVSMLSLYGRYVLCGTAGGMPVEGFGMSILMNAANSISFSTTSLAHITDVEVNGYLANIFDLAADNKLSPYIDKILPLSLASEAHELMESGSVFGKIVLTV